MDNMDTKVLISIISACTVVVSATISSLVTLYVSRRSLSKESDKNAIRYLERKIELLEKQKSQLTDFMRRSPEKQDAASAFAELTTGRFNLAKDVLREIEHYLNDEVRKQISDDCDIVSKSFALELAKEKGVSTNDDGNSITGPKIMDRMHEFADKLALALDKELIASVNGIETLSGLRR